MTIAFRMRDLVRSGHSLAGLADQLYDCLGGFRSPADYYIEGAGQAQQNSVSRQTAAAAGSGGGSNPLSGAGESFGGVDGAGGAAKRPAIRHHGRLITVENGKAWYRTSNGHNDRQKDGWFQIRGIHEHPLDKLGRNQDHVYRGWFNKNVYFPHKEGFNEEDLDISEREFIQPEAVNEWLIDQGAAIDPLDRVFPDSNPNNNWLFGVDSLLSGLDDD
ncbi:MAG: hypothetical protein ABI843_08925 [Dokdonella sp.]